MFFRCGLLIGQYRDTQVVVGSSRRLDGRGGQRRGGQPRTRELPHARKVLGPELKTDELELEVEARRAAAVDAREQQVGRQRLCGEHESPLRPAGGAGASTVVLLHEVGVHLVHEPNVGVGLRDLQHAGVEVDQELAERRSAVVPVPVPMIDISGDVDERRVRVAPAVGDLRDRRAHEGEPERVFGR